MSDDAGTRCVKCGIEKVKHTDVYHQYAPAPVAERCAHENKLMLEWQCFDCDYRTIPLDTPAPVANGGERGCGPGCYEPGLVAALRAEVERLKPYEVQVNVRYGKNEELIGNLRARLDTATRALRDIADDETFEPMTLLARRALAQIEGVRK